MTDAARDEDRDPFAWDPAADEVTGFGAERPAYEQQVRGMIAAGARWWAEHPGAEPGLAIGESRDPKRITTGSLEAAKEAGLLCVLNADGAQFLDALLAGSVLPGRETPRFEPSYLMLTIALHHTQLALTVGWGAYQAYLVRRKSNPEEPLPEEPEEPGDGE
jgi:hypothetical protein